MIDPDLREELLGLARQDGAVRAQLVVDGALFGGYNNLMAVVHRRNASRLVSIVEDHGWPGRSLVGEDGADAAWLVLKHAIAAPDLQRRLLPVVELAAAAGEVPPWHPATLADGICFYEGRPQVYGSMFHWDEQGELTPWPIEDPAGVDERRRAVGLPPLANQIVSVRMAAEAEGEHAPADPAASRREADEWARSVGWRD